jgi:ankyrin repeat protein
MIYVKGSLLGLVMFCYAAIFIPHERWRWNAVEQVSPQSDGIDQFDLDFESRAWRELLALESNRPTWMITAAYKGDIVRMQQLINEGVDVNAQNDLGVTALISAASGLQHEAVSLLLSHGADRSAKTNEG